MYIHICPTVNTNKNAFQIKNLCVVLFIKMCSVYCDFMQQSSYIRCIVDYTIGTNTKGCSGIDDTARTVGGDNCCYTPRKVDTLCKQQIESFVSSTGPHVLALTRNGEIYSWGNNSYGEVGRGDDAPNPSCIPAKVTSTLDGIRILQVACGASHSMALSDEGKVHAMIYHNFD